MATRYWVGGDGNWGSTSRWSTSSGGSSGASVPTSTDDVVFDSNSSSGGSLQVALSGGSCANLSIDNSVFYVSGFDSVFIYGNLTVTNWQFVDKENITFYFYATSGTKTISSAKDLPNLTFNGVGGTWNFISNITAYNITLTNGTLNSQSYNVAVGDQGGTYSNSTAFYSSNINTRTLNMGSGVWSIYGSWDCTTSTNLTTSHSGSSLQFYSPGIQSGINFYGGNKSYPELVHNVTDFWTGLHRLTIYGSNTFTGIKVITSASAKTLRLESGKTTTITSSLILSGVSGKQITLNTTASSQATISASPGTVSPATYTTISYSNATGGASFQALLTSGNVNGGNNTGWTFVAPPSGGFLAFF